MITWINRKVSQIIIPTMYILIGVVLGFLLAIIIFNENFRKGDFFNALGPEAVGILFTVFGIDMLLRVRQNRQEIANYKLHLIRELGSQANPATHSAAHYLRRNHGRKQPWIADGSLKKQDFINANWEGVDVSCSVLEESRLWYLKGKKANLYLSDLHNTELWRADLSESNLKWADLSGAWLAGTDLRGADLTSTNLKDACLIGMESYEHGEIKFYRFENGATELNITMLDQESDKKVYSAKFDETTKLPDGTFWSDNTDMRRFTNPNHDLFWKPKPDSSGKYPWWYEPGKDRQKAREKFCHEG